MPVSTMLLVSDMADKDRPNLRNITVDQVRLGMHLHALDGRWLDHPFWKSGFVLRDPADLKLLRASRVPSVWIDTALGCDLAAAADDRPSVRPSRGAPAPTTGKATATWKPATAATARPVRTAMAEEVVQAARLCSRSREVVGAMFARARMGRALETERCLPLVGEITDSVFRNPGAMVGLARLKTRDDYSYMHSVAVVRADGGAGPRDGPG